MPLPRLHPTPPQPCLFMQYLAQALTTQQVAEVTRLYNLESRPDGGIIFWLTDAQGQCTDGKVMYYKADGHRDKAEPRHPRWISKVIPNAQKSDTSGPRLYGQHLLSLYPDRPVCIVESEKTAILASQWLEAAGYIWMATGGESFLKVESFAALASRPVIVYPDTDPQGKTFRSWQEICQKAAARYSMQIYCSPLLEQQATAEEKERKIDIADKIGSPSPALPKGEGD